MNIELEMDAFNDPKILVFLLAMPAVLIKHIEKVAKKGL